MEANSANQTDQLDAMRFKMKSKNSNLPSSKIEEISESDMQGTRKEIPKEETYNKYGDMARTIEIDEIENAEHLREFLCREFRMRGN